MSKVSNIQPHADVDEDATKPDVKNKRPSQNIEFWEDTYRECFALRLIIPSFRLDSDRNPWLTFDPLWGLVNKPVVQKPPLENVERWIKNSYRVKIVFHAMSDQHRSH